MERSTYRESLYLHEFNENSVSKSEFTDPLSLSGHKHKVLSSQSHQASSDPLSTSGHEQQTLSSQGHQASYPHSGQQFQTGLQCNSLGTVKCQRVILLRHQPLQSSAGQRPTLLYKPNVSTTATMTAQSKDPRKSMGPVQKQLNEDPVLSTRRKRTKKEKDRLCHIVPEEFLYAAEENFLRLIFASPAIWNPMIDIKQRHPDAKAKKWIDIQKEMQAYLKGLHCPIDVSAAHVDLLKNTWTKIREAYVRYKSECQAASGSEADDVREPEHVDTMRTYDPVIAHRKQVSSLRDESANEDNGKGPAKNSKRPKHKRTKKESDDELSPFIPAATFLEQISDDGPMASNVDCEDFCDRSTLFADSIVPDLQRFDDEHFAQIKMIISKSTYDVYVQ